MSHLTTELDAVNQCLAATGTAPVNSLEGMPKDASLAHQVVTKVKRRLQARGWHWNTSKEVKLLRDTNNEIAAPANAIKVDVNTKVHWDVDVILRDGKLFDLKTNSSAFTKDLTYCEIVYHLPWDSMSETARIYIAEKSARHYAASTQPDAAQDRALSQEEISAWADLQSEEIRQSDASMFNSVSVNRQFLTRYRRR